MLIFLFSVDDLAAHNIPQGPDWRRLTILFTWYLAGIPTAYMMHGTCAIGAPGTWARGIRVFIEGIVAFGLGGFIYVGISFRDWAFRLDCLSYHPVFFDRDSGVICSQYTSPVRYCYRTHRKRCLQVQMSSSPVVQSNQCRCPRISPNRTGRTLSCLCSIPLMSAIRRGSKLPS